MMYNKITHVQILLWLNFLQLLDIASFVEGESINKSGIEKRKCHYLQVFINRKYFQKTRATNFV